MIALNRLYSIAKDFRVLYVEDDIVLQNKTKSFLKNIFKIIDTADDGEEALLKYESFKYEYNFSYDLVITDIKMPNLHGVGLAKKILQIDKEQKIIVTSAYSDKDDLIAFINLGITKFIQKPFTAKQIIDLLLEVVETNFDNNVQNYFNIGENLVWNKLFKELKYNENTIKLSFNETKIIDLLIQNPQQIFSNFELFELLGDENQNKEFSIDSVKSIVKRLRQKLPFDIIENIYGHGYTVRIGGNKNFS